MKDEVCEEMEVGDEVPTRTDPSKSPVVCEDEVIAWYAVALSSVTSPHIVYNHVYLRKWGLALEIECVRGVCAVNFLIWI